MKTITLKNQGREKLQKAKNLLVDIKTVNRANDFLPIFADLEGQKNVKDAKDLVRIGVLRLCHKVVNTLISNTETSSSTSNIPAHTVENVLKSIRVLCLIAFYYDKSKFTNQNASKFILGTNSLIQKLRDEDLMQLSLLGLPQDASENAIRMHFMPFILGFHVAYLQLFLEDNSVPMYPESFIEQINIELKNDTAEKFTTHAYCHKRNTLIGNQKKLLLNPVIKIPGMPEQDRKSFFNPLFQGVEWFIALLYKFISQSDNLDHEQKTRLVKNLLTTIKKLSNIENKYAFFEVQSFLSQNKEEALNQKINHIPIVQPQEPVESIPTEVNIQKTDNVPKIQPIKPVAIVPQSGTTQFCLKTQQWISQANSNSAPVANENLHEFPIIALLNQFGMFAPRQDANPVNEPPTKKFKSGPRD